MSNKTRKRRPEADYGSPAFREYLSSSPKLRHEYEDGQDTLRARLNEMKRALSSNQHVRRSLERLEATGADPNSILHGLALDAYIQGDRQRQGHWLRELQRNKRRLKGLATRIRSLASEIKETYERDESHPDLWDIALDVAQDDQPPKGGAVPTCERTPMKTISALLSVSGDLEAKACALGLLGSSETVRQQKRMVRTNLLKHIQNATGDAGPYLQTLSEVMAATYGQFKTYVRTPTKDALNKTLTRHVLAR